MNSPFREATQSVNFNLPNVRSGQWFHHAKQCPIGCVLVDVLARARQNEPQKNDLSPKVRIRRTCLGTCQQQPVEVTDHNSSLFEHHQDLSQDKLADHFTNKLLTLTCNRPYVTLPAGLKATHHRHALPIGICCDTASQCRHPCFPKNQIAGSRAAQVPSMPDGPSTSPALTAACQVA